MSRFAIPRSTNQDIAGPSAELVDRLVAFRPEGVVNVTTEYGVSPALRVTTFAITDKGYESLGLRLIFWTQVRKAIADVTGPDTPWAVGRVVNTPQAGHDDRTVYLLDQPSQDELALIGPALDSFEEDEAAGRLV